MRKKLACLLRNLLRRGCLRNLHSPVLACLLLLLLVLLLHNLCWRQPDCRGCSLDLALKNLLCRGC